MSSLLILTATVGSYLLGCIPFGLLVGKWWKGIDIRQFGSGNIGASNVWRTLGPAAAVVVFVLDTAKGGAAVVVTRLVGVNVPPTWVMVAALCCIAGHNWSVFLRFQGGRGVATALGALLATTPVVGLTGFGLWIVFVALTRYISVASIIATISIPVHMALRPSDRAYLPFGLLAAVFVLIRHRANIRRLLRGVEYKIGQHVEPQHSEKDASSHE